MRIKDLLVADSIELNGTASHKQDALDKVIDLMVKSGKIADAEAYRKGVLDREAQGSTGIGGGIAIPHCKSAAVESPGLAVMRVREGVEFDSLDGGKVDFIFLIAASDTEDNLHLEVLGKLSKLLMNKRFRERLRNAESIEEFLDVIDAAEKLILAVTACPTGIAHTYMAQEALEKTAQELGYRIKVETRGSGGVKNILTAEEIAEADCIIVAADTQIPMERFAGKPVIQCKVADGIGKPEELLKRAVSGVQKEEKKHSSDGLGHQLYKHLMNGVSHMLPFVVGGGILIALAFLIDGFSVDLQALTLEERAAFGTITPMAAMFKNIGSLAFGFMLPVLAGYIAMSIADRPGLAVGVVGGVIAANGTSGFLGALAAGFLAGYLLLLLQKLLGKLPKGMEGLKPVMLYPVLGIFLIGMIMIYLVEPPVGALNTLMNSWLNQLSGASAVLLGALLAGMMAVDMGGPVNKAAYVFGTASIAAGNYHMMAAVMIGGMVPPIAIAFATLCFKRKFTEEQRKTGPTNLIMGLSFITEGAIPFAASDPLRVIPACIAGSAVAGALSTVFGCTLMAPHGGIFVFPTVTNPLLYLVALLGGSLVGCVLLGLLKKNVK